MSQNHSPINPHFRFLLEHYFREDFGRVVVHRGGFYRLLTRWLRVRGVTLGNHVYIAPGVDVDDYPFGFLLLAHEVVHVLQYRRQGFSRFLARYGREFFRGIFSGKAPIEAYREVAAEVEAFAVEAGIRELLKGCPRIGEVLKREDLRAGEKIEKLKAALETGKFPEFPVGTSLRNGSP